MSKEAADRISALLEEVAEREASFNLRWNADRRACTMWQAAGEGCELTWPDHADLCVWLLEEVERLKALLNAKPSSMPVR